jgi:UPF0042 nucleotide-binding protein
MGLVVVSGLSGAGKSVAMHALEDLGYYCVDNLPVRLLNAFLEGQCGTLKNTAVSIDARSGVEALVELPERIRELRESGAVREVIFLEAVNDVLLNRFSETRRKHPLSGEDNTLAEALALERDLLEGVRAEADSVIDTTLINLHQLRDLIRRRVEDRSAGTTMALMFESFGYKHGIPATADLVFDARCLPNPYWEPPLRSLTGQDRDVASYLAGQPVVEEYFQELMALLERWIPRFEGDNRAYFTVAIGCTGGQHRSVYMVERLSETFREQRSEVLARHRELATKR